MKSDVMPNAALLNDAHLVELVLEGNRDAFGQLVARYQSPVCALAYNACGDISQSEDLAQESFVVAWRKLRDLKEPAKFKSWLYGIARNLINNTFRQQLRNPLAGADLLDDGLTTTAAGSNPTEQAMNKEEEGILWRSLEQIPEIYREPLVLFYREQQSIEPVAAVLDLSEEAVRQRLSRGRKVLQERVIAFVEGALANSGPNQAFTVGVMSVLPALKIMASSSVIGGTAIKGGAAGKAAASMGFFSTVLGPFIMIFPAAIGTWLGQKIPDTQREKKFARKSWGILWGAVILFIVAVSLVTNLSPEYLRKHPNALTYGFFGTTIVFFAFLLPYSGWMARTQARLYKEEAEKSDDPQIRAMSQPFEYRSRRTLLGLPLVHVRFNHDLRGPAAKGWIAIGTKAYGIVYASGAIAVGFVSWGALAIGAVGLGGFGVGWVAFGGLAIGVAAFGGAAIGYMGYGGTVIAWLAGAGGVIFSHHFALGGGVIAPHANDEAAKAFMRSSFFFRYVEYVVWPLIAVSFVLPPALHLYWKRWRKRKAVIVSATF